ncbi:NAD(P)H-quinone oxidoreductase [Pseudacidovorax sp. NFM-22]|uniref:NAD(P)H-quinone oxidoreductase n=1 Tax=Pseudacidovorax sp. NFM-22 TaxID=2744469 RepID=UPI001F3960D6|nr:NAD(P)H-quinone oxidoreductase [Pseudacidovorax sp. NFM-22]
MDATNLPDLRADGLVIRAPGGPEVLRWTPGLDLPVPAPDEVLIDVAWAGVNRHDCNQRRRGPTPAHSDVPGLEVSGTVRRAGARAGHLRVGDAVCALVDGGGYATRVVAPAALTFAVPPGLALREAAALPEALFTVWHNFFGVAALGPGETVLIHGGTSGVGSLALQLLGALGHRVAVTCGNAAKVAEARTLGAAAAFDYRTQDWVQAALDWTDGRGVDVVLDMAGAAHAARNVQVLARRGRLVHLSPGDGADFVAPLRPILAKELRITGSLLRPLPLAEKALIAERLRAVALPLVAAGRVRPWVSEVFPLAEAAQAHARLESGQAMGKLVLEVRGIAPRA